MTGDANLKLLTEKVSDMQAELTKLRQKIKRVKAVLEEVTGHPEVKLDDIEDIVYEEAK